VWLDALRSGKFKQAIHALEVPRNADTKAGFCCLGVACKVMGEEAGLSRRKIEKDVFFVDPDGLRFDTSLPPAMVDYLGFRKPKKDADGFATSTYMGDFPKPVYFKKELSDGFSTEKVARSLAELNDAIGMTFEEIADFIEKNPSKVWKKGTYALKKKKKKKGA
jgi:hypothetical protein